MSWGVPRLTGTALVRCDCGRRVPPSEMLDLSSCPPGRRKQVGLPADVDAICEACWVHLDHFNERRGPMLQALGAPQDLVDRMAAKQRRGG